MDVNFEYYKVFYYVAKYGNFTRAANALVTSQPAITYSIRNLEKALGSKLFVRSRRGVTLTPEGELLYSFVEPAYERLTEGEEKLRSAVGERIGRVNICATEIAVTLYISRKLKTFHSACPGVKLDIMGYNTPKALEELKTGRFDIAVVTSPFDMERSLESSVVKNFTSSLYASTASSDRANSMSLTDAARLPLVITHESSTDHQFYSDLFRSRGVVMSPTVIVESALLVLNAVARGIGVGFVPDELAAPQVSQGAITRIELDEEIPCRDICVVRDRHRPLGGAAKILIEILEDSKEAMD